MAFNQEVLIPIMLVSLLILQSIRDLRRDIKNTSTWFTSSLYMIFAFYYMLIVIGKFSM